MVAPKAFGTYLPAIHIRCTGAGACENPTQTAVDSRGVYPTNQVSSLWVVVPVLPADGNGGAPTDLAVPFHTLLRAKFIVLAYLGSIACVQLACGMGSSAPSAFWTLTIAIG